MHVSGAPFTQCNQVALRMWEHPAWRYDMCPRALWGLHPTPQTNAWYLLLPRLSGGCSFYFLWGLEPQPYSWAQYWHNQKEITVSSFLIRFWKCSTRGYVSHIHNPLTPTNLFVRWYSVCTTHFMLKLGYFKLMKEEESFDFMTGKKLDMEVPIYVKWNHCWN